MFVLDIGSNLGPPPPLAAAIAAHWTRAGEPWVLVDPRGWARRDVPAGERWWLHLEGAVDASRLAPLGAVDAVTFGPGAGSPLWQALLAERGVRVLDVLAEPEPPVADIEELAIPTFRGFGDLHGGAFRLLGSRFGRVKRASRLIQELVYLRERWAIGHALFDDADLHAVPGWWTRVEDELRTLPFTLPWQGMAGDRVIRGCFGPQRRAPRSDGSSASSA